MSYEPPERGRWWTEEQTNHLRAVYGLLPPSKIAHALQRTEMAVRGHAKRNGISARANRKAMGLTQRADRHSDKEKHKENVRARYHRNMKDPAYRQHQRELHRKYRRQEKMARFEGVEEAA
jgi:hypothetical protein